MSYVSSIVSFSFLYSDLWLGSGLNTVCEDNIGLKLVPMRRLRVLRTRSARPCTLATLASQGLESAACGGVGGESGRYANFDFGRGVCCVSGAHDCFRCGIKDLENSNGTFISCERLRLEGIESEPYELKSDDTVVSHLIPSALSCRSC